MTCWQSRIHQSSMEAGERWMLNDVMGKAIRAWDSRGHNFGQRVRCSCAGPRVCSFRAPTPPTPIRAPLAAEVQFQKIEYGEGQPALALTCALACFKARYRRRGNQHGTQPGHGQDEAYDFKGNLLRGSGQFLTDYKAWPTGYCSGFAARRFSPAARTMTP